MFPCTLLALPLLLVLLTPLLLVLLLLTPLVLLLLSLLLLLLRLRLLLLLLLPLLAVHAAAASSASRNMPRAFALHSSTAGLEAAKGQHVDVQCGMACSTGPQRTVISQSCGSVR